MADTIRDTPIPTEIKLHQTSRLMEVTFSDGAHFKLPYELLRVFSPSAEVRGHGNEVLQTGKRDVAIVNVEPVGNYAIKPEFSDGHDSGIYSWDILYALGAQQEILWQDYLTRLEEAGANRDIDTTTVASAPAKSCGKH